MNDDMTVMPEINSEDALKYIGMAVVLKWFLDIIF